MKRTAIIAAMLLLGAARAGAQVDSCLAYFDTIPQYAEGPKQPGPLGYGYLWQPNHNPDSVLVDTCSTSATYGELYITHWIRVVFDSDILQIPADSVDSVVQTTWEAIDTNYPLVRSGFSALESKYGSFVLQKAYPKSGIGADGSSIFGIGFSSYVCEDSVLNDVASIPLIESGIANGLIEILAGVVQREHTEVERYLFPNPAKSEVQINGKELQDVRLFDEAGRCVRSWPHANTFDLVELTPGRYLLVSTGGSFRLIIE